MKIKIDKYGHLHVLRGTRMQALRCPFSGGEKPCGDWCPFFDNTEMASKNGLGYDHLVLRCFSHGPSLYGEIDDQRQYVDMGSEVNNEN